MVSSQYSLEVSAEIFIRVCWWTGLPLKKVLHCRKMTMSCLRMEFMWNENGTLPFFHCVAVHHFFASLQRLSTLRPAHEKGHDKPRRQGTWHQAIFQFTMLLVVTFYAMIPKKCVSLWQLCWLLQRIWTIRKQFYSHTFYLVEKLFCTKLSQISPSVWVVHFRPFWLIWTETQMFQQEASFNTRCPVYFSFCVEQFVLFIFWTT